MPRFSWEFARECSAPFWNVSSEAKTIDVFDVSFDVKHNKYIRAARVLIAHSYRTATPAGFGQDARAAIVASTTDAGRGHQLD